MRLDQTGSWVQNPISHLLPVWSMQAPQSFWFPVSCKVGIMFNCIVMVKWDDLSKLSRRMTDMKHLTSAPIGKWGGGATAPWQEHQNILKLLQSSKEFLKDRMAGKWIMQKAYECKTGSETRSGGEDRKEEVAGVLDAWRDKWEVWDSVKQMTREGAAQAPLVSILRRELWSTGVQE